jgi:hypothetical protein
VLLLLARGLGNLIVTSADIMNVVMVIDMDVLMLGSLHLLQERFSFPDVQVKFVIVAYHVSAVVAVVVAVIGSVPVAIVVSIIASSLTDKNQTRVAIGVYARLHDCSRDGECQRAECDSQDLERRHVLVVAVNGEASSSQSR